MKNLFIIGAGKLGRQIYSFFCQSDLPFKFKGFLDARKDILSGYNYQEQIVSSAEEYIPEENDVFVCAIGDPQIKKEICQRLIDKKAIFINLIHPTAILGKNVKLGIGNIICPYCVLSCDIEVGNHVLIDMHSVIAHDVKIKDYVQIACNTTINGCATINEAARIYSNACVLPNITIEKNATVGAGSVAIKTVPEGKTIFGVPGRIIT